MTSALLDPVEAAPQHQDPKQEAFNPSDLPLRTFLKTCKNQFNAEQGGHVADYIPELLKADPDHFGIALTTVDGHTHAIGDADVPFTIQSVSKAFVYALAIEYCGHEKVSRMIGVEPSGDAFNSIRLSGDNRPFNPMVNAGAIACSGLVYEQDKSHAFERIKEVLSQFAGRDLDFDEQVYKSESLTGDRNRAIAWLLKNNSILESNVDEALDVYFKQCAILVTARDLSIMGATLANNGINPITGLRVINPLTAARTLSVMVSSGMYDYSGEWIYRVGLPAKSGVGGGIVCALPAQIGLGTYSPKLDELGNSVRGLKVCEEFSSHFALHLLARQSDVKTSIAAEYTISEVASNRDRRADDKKIIARYGEMAHIIELAGAMNFVSCDYISRRVFERKATEIEIFDFRRVSGISAASAKLLISVFQRLAHSKARVVLTGLRKDSFPATILDSALSEVDDLEVRRFTHLDDAKTWAEDQIIYTYGGFNTIFEDTPISEQPLLMNLSENQLRRIEDSLELCEFAGGTHIIDSGTDSDSLYFLTKGMVSIILESGVRVAALDAGTCFGEFSLVMPDTKRSAHVVADSLCRCQKLPIESLKEVSKTDPEIHQIILQNLSILLVERLRQANNKIETLA